MKRIVIIGGLFLCLLLADRTVSMAAETPNLTEDARAAILLERDTGEILYEKKADEKLPPASMTKIMTLLLIMEAIDQGELNLEENVTISERASSMGGSQVFLEAGEEMKVDDLIKAIAIASANDASVALAERLTGSEAAFVTEMNEKAKALGLTDTHFVNASGLPADNHYSTAHDMAKMAKELLKYETITNYTSIYEDYLRKGKENEFWLVNTNKLIHFYPYVDGLKTGYTSEAKFCLTATAKKEDMRMIAVVMGAETVKERNEMTMNLIDYGFNTYDVKKVFNRHEQVTSLRNLRSEKYEYPVVTAEPISTIRKKNEKQPEKIEQTLSWHQEPSLPTKKGTSVGSLTVQDGDRQYESDLIVREPIRPASYLTLWKRTWMEIAKWEE